MKLLVGALLIGAILMASSLSSVEGRKSMPEFCQDLNGKMSERSEIFADPEATYKLAHSLIHSSGFLQSDQALLDEAWRAVTYGEDCTSRSHEFVGAIYSCWPWAMDCMKDTLYMKAREYVLKCFPNPGKLDNVLRTEIKALSNGFSPVVTRFLDNNFIQIYFRYTPFSVHLLPVRNIECCRPENSNRALVDSINILHGDKSTDVASYYKQEPEKLELFLENHLIKPCGNYVRQMKPLMRTVMMLEKMSSEEKDIHILDALSQDFQKAMFRYKFCEHMEMPWTRRTVKQLASIYLHRKN